MNVSKHGAFDPDFSPPEHRLDLSEADRELEAALEYKLCLSGKNGVAEVLDIVTAVLRRSNC